MNAFKIQWNRLTYVDNFLNLYSALPYTWWVLMEDGALMSVTLAQQLWVAPMKLGAQLQSLFCRTWRTIHACFQRLKCAYRFHIYIFDNINRPTFSLVLRPIGSKSISINAQYTTLNWKSWMRLWVDCSEFTETLLERWKVYSFRSPGTVY
jgi:hypothetical protein